MPLVQDTAIIVQTDVEAITGEVGLTNLDSGGATLANAMNQATNYLMLWLRGDRGIDPATVANVSELKIPAALIAAWLRLAAQPDEESQARAERLKKRFEEAFTKYVYISTKTGDEVTLADKGLPRSINFDSVPFFAPTDNRAPHQYNGGVLGGFTTK